MNQKTKLILISLIVASLFITLVILTVNSNESSFEQDDNQFSFDNDDDVLPDVDIQEPGEQVSDEDVSLEDVHVHFVGSYHFESVDDHIHKESSDQVPDENELSEDTRFIVVDQSIDLSSKDQELLNQFVEDDLIVLFSGKGVDTDLVQDALDEEFEIFEPRGSGQVEFILYGFGYSEKHAQKIPHFLATNTSRSIEELTINFLSEKGEY